MKTKIIVCLVLLLATAIVQAQSLGTAFNYQGQLNVNGIPANGSYDFYFILYTNSTTTTETDLVPTNGVPVTNGLFVASIDFGSVFTNGTAYWLGISVATNGSSSYTPLNPRQPLTPTPYAIFANTASNLTGTAPTATTANNFSGSLAGDVTGTQSATVVATVGQQTAANVASGVIAANAATSGSTPNTIVQRDASGNFSAGTITANLSGNATTATSATTASTASTANNFSGSLSGDVTGTQSATVVATVGQQTAANVASGVIAANAATSGSTPNTIVQRDGSGDFSAGTITLSGTLNVSGLNLGNSEENVAIGAGALHSANSSSSDNTATGSYALYDNTSGGYNTANGASALYFNTSGSDNTASGFFALYNNTGSDNTAMGEAALYANTSGTGNIGVGYEAGEKITSGNNNIEIGNEGTSTDSAVIKIGTQNTQTTTYIAGISGVTVSSGVEVYVNSSGQLGNATSSARFKQDIKSMDNASDVLLSLHPVTFKYKPELDPQGLPQFGLVAEEVNKVDPDLVARDANGQINTVRYNAVNAMLLNEFLKQHRKVQEQSEKLQSQDAEIDTLKEKSAKVDSLEKQLNELKQMVQSLAEKK